MPNTNSRRQPAASIIIPHWNGKHHLPACLGALRRQTMTTAAEVILVDNGSTDGSQELVCNQFPEVRLLELGRNSGFTGACNAGFRVARGDVVVLLNNDTQAEPNWLEAVLDAFHRHPQAGSIASKLLLFDKPAHFHAAGDFYRVDGIPGNRGVWQEDVGQYEAEEEVFGACGAAAAYRRDALDEVGFLDDAFYFSCEDVDLAWRLQLRGWQVVYAPQAVVYHKLKATGGSVTGSYYDGRNFLYVIWKNYPTSLLRRNWRSVLRAQWRISRAAIVSWRGKAARARLRGQLAGLVGLPRMWMRRRPIQATRRVSDDYLMARLSAVDVDSCHR
ncbi:MAG TPA: glycosyltransferase family 2 protein [Candidatus Binatia bacterium]|nr:glycosyltransferase family 2 protein [Candidatus Binatia bacterium]